jgi:predicted permease
MAQMYADRLRDTEGWIERIKLRFEATRDVLGQAMREHGRRAAGTVASFVREGWTMDAWKQDLRFGFRALARRPGFTALASGTLALGIAATVSMFGVVRTVLLEPLPYPDSEALVVLQARSLEDGSVGGTLDHPDIRTIQDQVPEFTVAGYAATRPTLTGFGDPQVILGARVTDGLVSLMGLSPALGRDLQARDDSPDAPYVTVVSHDFWQRHLGGNRDVIGQTIMLSGQSWEIVGVAPEDFDFPGGSEVWMPRRHELEDCGHGCRILRGLGRIAPDAAVEDVQARLDAVGVRLAEEYPESHEETGFLIESLLGNEVESVRTALLSLLGAVAMVLLIACANVANLLLVRASARRPEIALRATLGASRTRIVRQMLTESLLVSAIAAIVGVAIAWWGTEVLMSMAPASLPRLDEVSIDASIAGFAIALAFAVTALFGVLPALQATRRLDRTARDGNRTEGARDSDRSRSLLLSAEIALSLVLLLGTGLLLRTLGEIRAVDLGFDTQSVERFRFSVPGARYDSLGIVAFIEEVERELEAIPGVAAAGWGFGVPLAGGNITTSIRLLDRPEVDPQDRPEASIRPVSNGFLEAQGMRLLSGRWFDERDRYGSPGVAVINETMAQAHYPDADPIGKRIGADVSWSFEETPEMTIVGVLADVTDRGPTIAPRPAVYLPNAHFGANSGYALLRLEPGVASVIPEARGVISRLDPGIAIWGEASMDTVFFNDTATTEIYTTLLTVFSVIALVLAAVGLYGVVSYSVSRRTREIGIRIALGAGSDYVVGTIIRQAIRPAVLGVVVGLLMAGVLGRLLQSLLFGVSAMDPLAVGTSTAVILLVSLAATAIPALRASRVHPSEALRNE